MPITPTLSLLPDLSEISSRVGIAFSCVTTPPRSTPKTSSRPPLALTMLCITSKDPILRSSMLMIKAPTWKPASAATPPATTSSTLAAVTLTPDCENVNPSSKMANRKLALRPAAMIAARAIRDLVQYSPRNLTYPKRQCVRTPYQRATRISRRSYTKLTTTSNKMNARNVRTRFAKGFIEVAHQSVMSRSDCRLLPEHPPSVRKITLAGLRQADQESSTTIRMSADDC